MGDFDAEHVARFENATWSRCAGGYVTGFGPLVREAITPLLDAAAVGEGDRVVDLGTGPGLVANAAAERGAEPVGVDFSGEMLAEAARLHPGIEFREASIDDLPFGDGRFDAAVANFVMHHVGRPGKVLEEVCRVLRPGGRVAFTVWGEMEKLEAFGLFFAAVEEHVGAPEFPHGPMFGVSDFEVFHGLLRDAGFRETTVTELDIAWRTPSLETFLDAFRDWADLGALPTDTGRAIEATVRERAEAYRRDGVFAMPNPAILASAVK